MKKIALIALLSTVGLTQVAHAYLYKAPCPEGTYLTSAGHCQPDWDFD
ncbi:MULTISPECIES: hypothetical protein [unclassified Pseudomonas]|nr:MULTISPECIES: hypothetical protein [unclassified Pseudomonas]MCO7518467.1 hypothetical protein [Pseudomonas sp. 1]MCO7542312.1 hypothetical protein [Pseudomonas sp. VA159-2]